MTNAPLPVPALCARRFLIREFALDAPPSLPTVSAVLERLEFVQEDSINSCGRIHDLILRNRIAGYAPEMLHQALYNTPRAAFEYYFPNLCVLPMRDLPYFRRTMLSVRQPPGRWRGLTAEEEPIAELLLTRMDTEGPLRSRLTGTEHGHAMSGWGTRAKVASLVLDKLWYQGHLAIAKRENFERWFDRAARLHPEWETDELPDATEEARYKTRKRLHAKRLFRLTRASIEALGAAAFIPVAVEGDKRVWHILAEDRDDLLAAAESTLAPNGVRLLAPLDPLVYDRERNRRLFGFDYTWEVYVPAEKRKWGYYVLPLLYGEALIGRVDPKINRATGVLTLHSLTLEPGVRAAEVGPAVQRALQEYARFVGATTIEILTAEPPELRKYVP